MKLTVLLPSEVLLEEEVVRIKAEAENGWFGILPKHVDLVTALVPGVLVFERPGHPEEYLAVDHGILVKCGPEVRFPRATRCGGPAWNNLSKRWKTSSASVRRWKGKRALSRRSSRADLVRRLLEEEKRA